MAAPFPTVPASISPSARKRAKELLKYFTEDNPEAGRALVAAMLAAGAGVEAAQRRKAEAAAAVQQGAQQTATRRISRAEWDAWVEEAYAWMRDTRRVLAQIRRITIEQVDLEDALAGYQRDLLALRLQTRIDASALVRIADAERTMLPLLPQFDLSPPPPTPGAQTNGAEAQEDGA